MHNLHQKDLSDKSHLHLSVSIGANGAKYSQMDQVKFVEDSL